MPSRVPLPWRRRSFRALAVACGVVLSEVVLCGGALFAQAPLAPDGRRGFGAQTPVNEVLAVVRSNAEPERAFRNELDSLASEIKVLAALARQSYEQAQYFELLEPLEERSIDLLHQRFAKLDADPLPSLTPGGARARSLASMLLDTRFRVRARVLDGCEAELSELERGLRVLRAATDGFVLLTQAQASNVTARVDLAASLLRAIRNDLRALREAGGISEVDPALVERLLEAARASEGEGVRRAHVQRERDSSVRFAELMASALFTTRLRPQIEQQLQWRDSVVREARPFAEQAERALPESDATAPPDPKLAALGKSDRIRHAGYLAAQAAELDPLAEGPAWIVAHAAEFQYGTLESRAWYDRYLALRRIRSHDHRTYAERKLTPREAEALEAVQRGLVPGQPRVRGF